MHIETPKVSQLRYYIYLGLKDGLGLPDHTGGIGLGTVLLGEEIGRFEKDLRSSLKRPSAPVSVSL
jgi:hypothetical protein